MAIVYRGRKRKFVEAEHPRNPNTGEFVEKTGAHASWLMRIANRTQGPNLGGGMLRARAGFGPAGTGRVAANSLKRGDHAKVVGVDASGKPMTLNGYVQGASGVNVRQRGRKTPMIAVQVAETPSGGGANWRGTVYVEPGARVQKTSPKAPSRDAQAVATFSDERIEDELAKAGREMDALGSNQGATVRRMEVQQRLTALRQERSRRQGALQERISADIARQRGEVDTSRVKPDTGGMAPTSSAPSGKPITNMINAVADQLERDYPGATKARAHFSGSTQLSTVGALRAIANRHETGDLNKQDTITMLNRLAINNARSAEGGEVSKLAKALKKAPARAPKVAPEPAAPKTHAEKIQDSIASYHKSFAGVVIGPDTKAALKELRRKRNVKMPHEISALIEKIDKAEFDALPEADRNEIMQHLDIAMRSGASYEERATLARLRGEAIPERPRAGVGGMSPILAVSMMAAPDSKLARNVRGQIGRATRAAGRGQEQVDDAVKVLKTTDSRDEARRALDGLTVAQLKQVYEGLKRRPTATRKADMVDRLVQTTVEARITSEVLRGDGPNSWANDTVTARRAAALAEAEKPTALQRLAGGKFVDGEFVPNADARPAPTPPATAYASITKRATLLSMLRQRGLKAKRGAPDDDLRALLVLDDDRKRGVQGPGPVSARESVADAQTVESLAGMKRAALLAVRRNTPGARNLRRGASEREIAEEIVRARNANMAADRADTQAIMTADLGKAPAAPISDNDLSGDIPAAVNRLAAMPAADARKLLDAQRHSTLTDLARALSVRVAPTTPSLIKNIESGLKVERLERMRQRTPSVPESRLAPTVSTPAPSTPADMSPLRLDSQIDAAERLIKQTRDALEVEQARRGTGGMLTDREIGLDAQLKATERKLRDLRAEKARRSDNEALAVQAAAPRPESQADIFRRHAQLTRAQFDALPQAERDRIIAELKAVRDSGEQQSHTIPSNRTSMGTTIRGLQDASWVRGAREKIRELTYVAPPPVDNSVRGRAARLREGDRYALEGATIAELGEIAEVAQFRRPGPSWKRDKAVEYLRNRAIIGDKMPTSYRPIQMAETMRGMDRGQALALLDYVEADFGITKTDMKEIARELGVTLRNGDKRAMMHALSAAAKDAPGKA